MHEAQSASEAVRHESPLLRVSDIHVNYPVHSSVLRRRLGSVLAVRGVSLDVASGQTIGIVGESGSGKSTLGRCIALLEAPTAGTVELSGRRVTVPRRRSENAVRRAIQMVFQNPAKVLNPRMTIGEIITEPLQVLSVGASKDRAERLEGVLDEVHLSRALADRKAAEVSGGQLQRVAIARSLVLDPLVLVLDEPVSALDASVQAHILNLLVDVQRERGLAYVFISHDLGVVEYVSDQVVVMFRGKVLERGAAADLLAQPAHPYSATLVEAVPSFGDNRSPSSAVITDLGTSAASADEPDADGCPYTERCPFAIDTCSAEPSMEEVGPDHFAACFRLHGSVHGSWRASQ